MDPDDDGQLLAGAFGSGVDVEEEAVLVADVFSEKGLFEHRDNRKC